MFIAAHNGARIWGGAERAVTRLLAGLQGRGHRVLLYCNDPVVAERAGEHGVPTAIQPLGGDAALHHPFRFARALRRDRPDVLIVASFKKMHLAVLAARLAGVPRVVARVGLQTDTPRSPKYRLALRGVDAVVVNAGQMRPAFLALPGWTAERVPVIHNGVRPPDLTLPNGAVRRALGITPHAPVIGTVARLAWQKRVDRLMEVMALLPDDVQCLIAGDGGERPKVEALAERLGVRGRVHFLGRRDDVGNVLDALDVFVITSDTEGLSNAMLEALASGVPVISTPVSGAAEALEPPPDGAAPPGEVAGFDPPELAAAIGRVLADPGRRREMAEASRERARERFGVEGMLDRWEAVLAGRGGEGP